MLNELFNRQKQKAEILRLSSRLVDMECSPENMRGTGRSLSWSPLVPLITEEEFWATVLPIASLSTVDFAGMNTTPRNDSGISAGLKVLK